MRMFGLAVLELVDQEIHHPLERIEPECRGDRGTQVRVGVDVVEHAPAVERIEIFDAADVEPRRADNLLRGRHGCAGYLGEWIELDRWCLDYGLRAGNLAGAGSVVRI